MRFADTIFLVETQNFASLHWNLKQIIATGRNFRLIKFGRFEVAN